MEKRIWKPSLMTSIKKLRAVHLNLRLKRKITECIGDLKHLRYLSIGGWWAGRNTQYQNDYYATTFTKLYHL